MKLVGFRNPDLIKYCDEEFNVALGCNSIRIGTLFGFRKEENELLRDKGEGEFEFKIRFPELTKVSPEWIGEFDLQGGKAHIDQFVFNNGDQFLSGVTFSGSAHNCWIYCLSTEPTGVAGSVGEAHNSSWRISGDRIDEFVGQLAQLVWESVSLKDLPDNLVSTRGINAIHSGLSLRSEIREVTYSERVLNINSEADFPVEKIREVRDGIAFMKPMRFREEKEVRIAFWLRFKGETISIPDNPKILDLKPTTKLISENKIL